MESVRWKLFAEAAPDLARFGEARLESGPAYLGTTRADGSPRVHPVTAIVRGGLLGLYMFPTSPKGKDLRRDGRYALHSTVDDTSGAGGEFALRGQAVWGEEGDVDDQLTASGLPHEDGYVRFELRVSYVIVANYVGNTNVPELRRWKASDG